jgi:glycosyltransferase involved in cell wall biosynthesis
METKQTKKINNSCSPINIYIQKPWKISDCASYKLIKNHPPDGINYINMGDSNLIQNPQILKINNFLKQSIKLFIKKIYPLMPNSHKSPTPIDYDLIHCEHCLSKNKSPWVANFEYPGQLWATGIVSKRGKGKILKLLKSEYCKKIIAWTDWCAEDIIREFPEIKNKVETVYPGIPFKDVQKNKDNKIRLLFISRRFYFKGGLYAVKVMDLLTKEYPNVEAIIISDTPGEVIERYSKNKKLNFMKMVPQKKLFEQIYPKCDIFVYPSFTDTFGFAIIESMGFGLPVVSVGGHSRDELIENGITGFVINNSFENSRNIMGKLENLDKRVVDNLRFKVEELIFNKDLRNKMSLNSKDIVKNGKFSIDYRNKRLKEIYLEALK